MPPRISARIIQWRDATFRPNVNVHFSLPLDKAQVWRRNEFPHEKFPTVEEILVWASEPDGANAVLAEPDLDNGTLKSRGGLPRALALFGKERLPALLEELNTALAA